MTIFMSGVVSTPFTKEEPVSDDAVGSSVGELLGSERTDSVAWGVDEGFAPVVAGVDPFGARALPMMIRATAMPTHVYQRLKRGFFVAIADAAVGAA
jgi:hypothetical protein